MPTHSSGYSPSAASILILPMMSESLRFSFRSADTSSFSERSFLFSSSSMSMRLLSSFIIFSCSSTFLRRSSLSAVAFFLPSTVSAPDVSVPRSSVASFFFGPFLPVGMISPVSLSILPMTRLLDRDCFLVSVNYLPLPKSSN